MKIIIKINNVIINDYLKDFKFVTIEQSNETIVPTGDKFDVPSSGAKYRTIFKVVLKGYELMNHTTIYSSEDVEKCRDVMNKFFERLLKAPFSLTGDEPLMLNLEDIIK